MTDCQSLKFLIILLLLSYYICMNILCPICKNELIQVSKSLKCCNNHCFDISKQGYVNLALNKINSGDNKEMINSRTLFLNSDSYLPLKEKLNTIINIYNPITLVDLACGEGYYTSFFKANNKYGIDLSKEAITYASKTDKTTTYLVSSIYDLPFKDNSIDIITTIFAPLADSEISRCLNQDGIFIFVSPGKYHLIQLKQAIYDNAYLNEETSINIDNLKLIDTQYLNYDFTLTSNSLIKSLFSMTPYYYKTNKNDADKLNQINDLTITASFVISVFKKI